jgi:hypothetical protein
MIQNDMIRHVTKTCFDLVAKLENRKGPAPGGSSSLKQKDDNEMLHSHGDGVSAPMNQEIMESRAHEPATLE